MLAVAIVPGNGCPLPDPAAEGRFTSFTVSDDPGAVAAASDALLIRSPDATARLPEISVVANGTPFIGFGGAVSVAAGEVATGAVIVPATTVLLDVGDSKPGFGDGIALTKAGVSVGTVLIAGELPFGIGPAAVGAGLLGACATGDDTLGTAAAFVGTVPWAGVARENATSFIPVAPEVDPGSGSLPIGSAGEGGEAIICAFADNVGLAFVAAVETTVPGFGRGTGGTPLADAIAK